MFLLWVVLLFSSLFWRVWPFFPSIWWGLRFSSLLLCGVAWLPSLGCVPFSHLLLRGAAFLPLLLWVWLVSPFLAHVKTKKVQLSGWVVVGRRRGGRGGEKEGGGGDGDGAGEMYDACLC